MILIVILSHVGWKECSCENGHKRGHHGFHQETGSPCTPTKHALGDPDTHPVSQCCFSDPGLDAGHYVGDVAGTQPRKPWPSSGAGRFTRSAQCLQVAGQEAKVRPVTHSIWPTFQSSCSESARGTCHLNFDPDNHHYEFCFSPLIL